MVVMGDTCVQSITAILVIVINCLLLSCIVAMAMAVMGDTCVQSITAIHTIIRLLCLRLSAVVIYCCHGDGSDGRHVCSKYHGFYHGDGSDGRHVCTRYHGHTYYYQQLVGCYVGNGAL